MWACSRTRIGAISLATVASRRGVVGERPAYGVEDDARAVGCLSQTALATTAAIERADESVAAELFELCGIDPGGGAYPLRGFGPLGLKHASEILFDTL